MDSHDMIAWSIGIATLTFVVLSIYLIRVLITANHSLASIRSAADETKAAISAIQREIAHLAHTANEISTDVQGKLQAADSLLETMREVGMTIRTVAGAVRSTTRRFSQSVYAEILQTILIHLFGDRVTRNQTTKEE